jgi:Fe-S-cluster containining protein
LKPEQAPWYADGLRFTCTQCGNCCSGAPGYVWVSDSDLRAIAGHFGLEVEEFRRRHTRSVGSRLSLLERDDGDCEFLVQEAGGKRRCGIYAVRPVQCRTWPFWDSNLQSGRNWRDAARTCPGMNHGEHHPLPVIQAARRRNSAAGLAL